MKGESYAIFVAKVELAGFNACEKFFVHKCPRLWLSTVFLLRTPSPSHTHSTKDPSQAGLSLGIISCCDNLAIISKFGSSFKGFVGKELFHSYMFQINHIAGYLLGFKSIINIWNFLSPGFFLLWLFCFLNTTVVLLNVLVPKIFLWRFGGDDNPSLHWFWWRKFRQALRPRDEQSLLKCFCEHLERVNKKLISSHKHKKCYNRRNTGKKIKVNSFSTIQKKETTHVSHFSLKIWSKMVFQSYHERIFRSNKSILVNWS